MQMASFRFAITGSGPVEVSQASWGFSNLLIQNSSSMAFSVASGAPLKPAHIVSDSSLQKTLCSYIKPSTTTAFTANAPVYGCFKMSFQEPKCSQPAIFKASSSCFALKFNSRRVVPPTAFSSSQVEGDKVSRELSSSSSSSSPAEEEEGQEGGSEDESQQGTRAEGSPFKESELEVLKEAIRRVAEEDLDVAVDKYDMRAELYAKIDYGQINAFTDRPFSGNPAAVCYLPYEKEAEWMQRVAREFNLSETAFLVKRRLSKKASLDGEKTLLELDASGKSLKAVKKNLAPVGPKNEFDLKWFTPKVEVDLCGHATLAAAHLLFTSGIVEDDSVLFHTKSGVLKAKKVKGYDEAPPEERAQAKGSWRSNRPSGTGVVELDFPMVPVSKCETTDVEKLSTALGNVEIVWAGITSLGDYLVEVPNSNDVKQLKPHFEKLLEFEGRGGVMVTSLGDPDSGFDFISRFFCPKAGIPEDSVTGSAHCTLGPYWADKLRKDTLEAYQASERGGSVSVTVDRIEGRVNLQGSAVLVMVGVLLNTG